MITHTLPLMTRMRLMVSRSPFFCSHSLGVILGESLRFFVFLLVGLLCESSRFPRLLQADDISIEEEDAFRTAVARAEMFAVRIEVIGAAEASEDTAGAGPSTGVVIGTDGWIITTSFAITDETIEAMVVFPDGLRRSAKVVSRDRSRGLVLIKIETSVPLRIPEPALRQGLEVGQWTLAIGRAWNSKTPYVAVGILSALDRAWGKAVQTDASISPANYGGPLCDIEGRVIGVLAPLPADTAGMQSGSELYDSGIGFAVPLEDILSVLPRLQAGETLSPGIIGIGYRATDPFTSPAVVATCRSGSPAFAAGLRSGDEIIKAQGKSISRIAQLRHVLAPLYANDTVHLVVKRATAPRTNNADTASEETFQQLPFTVTLVESLPPYRRPCAGIVLQRSTGDSQPAIVSWVWPNSAASAAGIKPADRIERIHETIIESATQLSGILAGLEPKALVPFHIKRNDTLIDIELTLGEVPVGVPDLIAQADLIEDAVQIETLEAPEVAKPPLAVLPKPSPHDDPSDDTTNNEMPLGILFFFDEPRGQVDKDTGELWRAAAARYGVVVVLPGSTDTNRWGRQDLPLVARALDSVRSRRPIDPSRIAVAGRGAGGAFAWMVAESFGGVFRGVALIDTGLPRSAKITPSDPGLPLSILFCQTVAQKTRKIDADRSRLEKAGLPFGQIDEVLNEPIPTERLAAWVESLGVL